MSSTHPVTAVTVFLTTLKLYLETRVKQKARCLKSYLPRIALQHVISCMVYNRFSRPVEGTVYISLTNCHQRGHRSPTRPKHLLQQIIVDIDRYVGLNPECLPGMRTGNGNVGRK